MSTMTTKDRSQFFQDLTVPFFSANIHASADAGYSRHLLVPRHARQPEERAGLHQGLFRDRFTADLKQVDVPTLVIHDDDDPIVPIDLRGRRTAQAIRGAILKTYPGGAHGLADTARDQLNADLLDFAKA
jgi:non-heme chloroperoxidase